MGSYNFTNKDTYKGFMTALMVMGVGWEMYDERLGTEVKPIESKDVDLYEDGITINFGEYGITRSVSD